MSAASPKMPSTVWLWLAAPPFSKGVRSWGVAWGVAWGEPTAGESISGEPAKWARGEPTGGARGEAMGEARGGVGLPAPLGRSLSSELLLELYKHKHHSSQEE